MGCCVYVQQPIFEQKIHTNVVRNSLWQNWYQQLPHFQREYEKISVNKILL